MCDNNDRVRSGKAPVPPPRPATRQSAGPLFGIVAALLVAGQSVATDPRPTQFVLVSFDATPSPRAPKKDYYVRAARKIAELDARFTIFINSGFLTLKPEWKPRKASGWLGRPPETYRKYLGTAPHNRPVIRYPRTPNAIERTLANIRLLHELGIEIASHTVRHDRGRRWSREQWRAEFDDHLRILDTYQLPRPAGFRAPFLEWNEDLFSVEAATGMRYDASRSGSLAHEWPRRIETADGPIWEMRIPVVRIADRKPTVTALFFDLNLSKTHHVTNAEYFKTALAEFWARYEGNRAPLGLGGHGGYMGAIVRVLRKVCGLEDVRCGTHEELADYMDEHPELAR